MIVIPFDATLDKRVQDNELGLHMNRVAVLATNSSEIKLEFMNQLSRKSKLKNFWSIFWSCRYQQNEPRHLDLAKCHIDISLKIYNLLIAIKDGDWWRHCSFMWIKFHNSKPILNSFHEKLKIKAYINFIIFLVYVRKDKVEQTMSQ